jgi:hypothetical protein
MDFTCSLPARPVRIEDFDQLDALRAQRFLTPREYVAYRRQLVQRALAQREAARANRLAATAALALTTLTPPELPPQANFVDALLEFPTDLREALNHGFFDGSLTSLAGPLLLLAAIFCPMLPRPDGLSSLVRGDATMAILFAVVAMLGAACAIAGRAAWLIAFGFATAGLATLMLVIHLPVRGFLTTGGSALSDTLHVVGNALPDMYGWALLFGSALLQAAGGEAAASRPAR